MRPLAFTGERDSGMVRLYAWVMIVAAGLTVVAALLTTPKEAKYSASAEVLIAPTITPSGNYIQPSMPTEQRVATSADVVGTTVARLKITSGQVLENLSVTVPVDTQVLVMTYTGNTPETALSGAKAIAESFLKVRNPADGKNAVASLVGPPELPTSPLGTNYPVLLGVAVLGGLLIGFAWAWAWDRLRGRIRTVAEAERRTGLDALAVLPRPTWAGDQRIAGGRPRLDSFAARVLGQVEGGPQFSLLVTGVGASCDSTAVAVQTALALTRMGRVAILVTADPDAIAGLTPRRESMGLASDTRLSFLESVPPAQLLVPMSEWDGGGVSAAKLTSLLPELHERMPEALVVIDGPPAWQSAGVALRADRILLVVAPGHSSRISASVAARALDHCSEKVMGLVIAPRRGRVQVSLASIRSWAMLRVKRVISRVAPLAPAATVSQDPVPTVLAPPKAQPTRTVPMPRAGTKRERARETGRVPVSRPEPSRSSAS